MKEKVLNKIYDNKLYLPSWLVSCLMGSWDEKQNLRPSYEMSCKYWDISRLKVLALLLDSLQRQILSKPESSSYELKLSSFEKEINPSLLRGWSLRSVFSDFSGLRFFYEDNKDYKAQRIFQGERYRDSSLFFEMDSFEQEIVLGVSSHYENWKAFSLETEDSRRKARDNFYPLSFDRSLFLDMKKRQFLVALNLLKSSQWQKQLVQLPNTYTTDLNSLVEQVNFGQSKKELSLAKELKMINRVLRQMNFHGYAQEFNETEFLFFDDDTKTQLAWQSKKDAAQDLSLPYKERVSSFFVSKALFGSKRDFFEKIGLGLSSEELSFFEKKFLEKIKSSNTLFTKDFIEAGKGSLLPSLFIFLELYLRSQQNHKVPLTQNLKLHFYPKPLESFNFEAEYLGFVKNLEQRPSFLSVLKEDSLFLCNRKLPKVDNLEKKSSPIKSFTPSSTESLAFKKEKEVRVDGSVIKKIKKQESPRGLNLPYQLAYMEDKEKKKRSKDHILQEIMDLRLKSKEQYRKIKDLYYNSLSKDSRTMISSLEKKMRQDLFDQQIQQHLVQYIVEQHSSANMENILASHTAS